MSGTDYTSDFYDTIAAGCHSSAEVLAPLVVRDVQPATVTDVGCGQGWWGWEFERLGCEVLGLDGAYVPRCLLSHFLAHDLNEPLPDLPRADLVVCLEVAEHLPEARAKSFVADLVRLGRFVLFSAAVPHQTGAGHVNLHWSSWWAALFGRHGYHADLRYRWLTWTDSRVEVWYAQNVVLMRPDLDQHQQPLDVIHPVIHEWGRTT